MDSQDSPRLELGGSHPPSPLIVLFMLSYGANIQMSFFPKTFEVKFQEKL